MQTDLNEQKTHFTNIIDSIHNNNDADRCEYLPT